MQYVLFIQLVNYLVINDNYNIIIYQNLYNQLKIVIFLIIKKYFNKIYSRKKIYSKKFFY